ncbi:hypothetical protein H4Q26_002064 [Puccinia striiformis f. sp. tritici PST-130]|nr:hypothetical protein H4Q26_002064 [Puccinia striiformis f. sp. tritici PST-130]
MPSGPMVVAHLLSHWTGNNSYRARADETSRHITNKPPTFPGRHSPSSTLSNGPPVSEIVSWGDKLNSHLGYGVKYWQLAGEPAMYYMKHWQDTVVVLIEHLLQWSPGNNHPYLAGYLQARGVIQVICLNCHASLLVTGCWAGNYYKTKRFSCLV